MLIPASAAGDSVKITLILSIAPAQVPLLVDSKYNVISPLLISEGLG